MCAGAVELVRACRAAGLKVAVGSSAEQVKVSECGDLCLLQAAHAATQNAATLPLLLAPMPLIFF